MLTTGTFGIDLASQPTKTAACMIEWDARDHGYVHCPYTGFTDQDLLSQMTHLDYVTRVGIDAPFGWPVDFITSITDYHQAGIQPDQRRAARGTYALTTPASREGTRLSQSRHKVGPRCVTKSAQGWFGGPTNRLPASVKRGSGEGHECRRFRHAQTRRDSAKRPFELRPCPSENAD
jgi:hypothetical protein